MLANIGSNYLNANIEAKRWGTAHESIVPYQSFKTKDGYITVGAGSNKQFKILCEASVLFFFFFLFLTLLNVCDLIYL